MSCRLGVVIALCACALACKERANKLSSPAPLPPIDESLFVIARPRVVAAPLPPRFFAPLPSSLQEADAGNYPPDPFIRSALATDTYEMRKRLAGALTRA